MGLLFLRLMTVYSLLRQRRITEALWILFFAYWSLVSRRGTCRCSLSLRSPGSRWALTGLWREVAEASSRQSTVGVLDDIAAQTSGRFRVFGLWTPLFLAGILWSTSAEPLAVGLFEGNMFPLAICCTWHADELARGRVFTLDQWADYLIYENYPRQRVFIDGRSDYYGEEIGKAYLAIQEARPKWVEAPGTILVRYHSVPARFAARGIAQDQAGWRIADQDAESILFSSKPPNLATRLPEPIPKP